MERFLLFIREPGSRDLAAIHPDESSARTALADYVRCNGCNHSATRLAGDDEAIAAYFDEREAIYAITRVSVRPTPADAGRCRS